MLPQQYCLRWKYHHSNLQTMFSQLLDRGCFCDVTLACDGQTLKAHRVVLSACSTYFDSILTNCNSEKDPIIILKDVKFMDIKYLVEFMYKGEINVEHNNLASLLKTAEELRIKGLAEVSWRDDENENTDSNDNNNNITESSNSFPHLNQTPIASNSNGSVTGKSFDSNKENLLKAIPFLAPLSSPKDLSAANRKKRGRPPLDESNHFTRGPKFVHLTNNEHYYENDNSETGKDNGIFDLSTSASSSTTNTITTAQTRLMHDENISKNHHEENHHHHNGASTSKNSLNLSPPQHLYSNSSNLVTVMMDDKSHDTEEHSFYMPIRRDIENGHNTMEFEEEPINKIVPKVERAETPNDLAEEEEENIMCTPAEHLQSIFLTDEERKQWNDVIRMNDYLTKGRRPQFWEEPFTKRVLDAIKNKNLEMKKAAKLLGVSYGTLYGRYRETYGCLKHPYRGPPGSYAMVSRMREMWPGNSDDQNDLLNLVQRNRMSMMQSDDVNGTNLMDMMHDEALMEQLAAKNFPRKIINDIGVANLLKQVQNGVAAQHQHQQNMQHKMPSPTSIHSISPTRSASPNQQQHMLMAPVVPSTSSTLDPSK